MKSGITMTAGRLKTILFIGLVLLFIAGGVSIAYAFQQLRTFNQHVNTLEANASISNDDIVKLQQLKLSLSENAFAISKTHRIVAESMSYRYQDDIINDLTRYANAADVGIAGFAFSSSGGTGGTAATTSPSTTTTPTTPTTPAAGTPGTLPSGIKTTSVTVSLDSPVEYSKFMKLIQLIETNTTKMQIKSISLSRPAGASGSSTKVEPQDLQIEVNIR